MKKYSEITLNDNEKAILEWFKGQWYTHVGRTTQYGFVEAFDENNDIRCNLKPMRKPFEFIEKGERYEIEKLLNPPHEPKTVWDLKNGDAFWWVSTRGIAYTNSWDSSYLEAEYRSQGNAFLTKEEAEFEAKRREVVTKVRKYARPFKSGNENWCPYWTCNYKEINFSSDISVKSPIDYFESKESIQKAIAEVGEEDFKKYYLGVTE